MYVSRLAVLEKQITFLLNLLINENNSGILRLCQKKICYLGNGNVGKKILDGQNLHLN